MRSLEEPDSQGQTAGRWGPGAGGGDGRECFMGTEFQFGKMEILEMDGGDGCTTV